MLNRTLGLKLILIAAGCGIPAALVAQQPASTISSGAATTTGTVVPRLVNFAGKLTDNNGKPLSGVVGVTFLLYRDPQGGAPLWIETQNVQPDKSGYYSVMLGSTAPQGLPDDLFVSGEARWLGVQVTGQEEQPRVLLVAVPYALKAHDAETIGGLPPSAFLLAPLPVKTATASATTTASSTNESQAPPPNGAITGLGTFGYIPLWDSTSDVINSALFQTGTGSTSKVGINTSTPATTLDVKGASTFRGVMSLPALGSATTAKGFNSQPLSLVASTYNSASSTPVNEYFNWQSEPVGNNTASTSASLNLLFGAGATKPVETGLKIASNGIVSFATGQTFPGTGSGTVTSVGSGAGLAGGPITGSGSLSIAAAGVTNSMLQNPSLTVMASNPLTGGGSVALGGTTTLGLASCATGQILKWSGSWACAADANSGGTVTSVASGTGLVGGPITTSGTLSVNPSVVPELALANTFTNTQAISTSTTGDALTVVNGNSLGVGEYVAGGEIGVETANQPFPINAWTTVGPEAVYGENDGTTRGDSGVLGATYGTSGVLYGVFGWNSSSALGAGVYGQIQSGNSVTAGNWATAGAGVWGDAGNSTAAYAGVLGTADNQSGGAFFNNGPNYFTLYSGAGSTSGYPFGAYNTANGNKGCGIDPQGDLFCTGSKNAVVPIEGGKRKVALAAIESPKNWFEDFGSEQLSNGSAVVQLEAQFAQTVNARVEYHVFLTPNGDCKGLYVTNKTATSFEVRELGGGSSSVSFDYRIVALRKDYETIRMKDHTNDPDPSKMPAPSAAPVSNPIDMHRNIPPRHGGMGHPLVRQAAK